jgi:Skp family chaperone for outer membrane proteins
VTQDEIIEMARQAGFVEYELDDGTTNAFDKRYEAFAKLVAAKEREACAKVCDELQDIPATEPHHCAEDIRARGEQA